MKKVVFPAIVLILLLGVALAIGPVNTSFTASAALDSNVEDYEKALTEALDLALFRQDSAVADISGKFEEIDNLLTAQEIKLRRYANAHHLQKARALGVGRVSGQTEIKRLVQQGRLVPLEESPYYVVQELTISVPYVTPDVSVLLDEVGHRFHTELHKHDLPLYRFSISSVLRTAENQQALRRINPNAARGVSTHEFGTTLDIVYHRYGYYPLREDQLPGTSFEFLDQRLDKVRIGAYDALGMRYWQELQGILGRVLIELQNEGKVFVTLEREQPVFHITVAEALARQ